MRFHKKAPAERTLLTGGGGFVGRRLMQAIRGRGNRLKVAVRVPSTDDRFGDAEVVRVGSIGPETDWSLALEGCKVVVHLAGQTPGPNVGDSQFWRVNDLGTKALAEQASRSGVELFLLLSTCLAVADNAADAVLTEKTPSSATSAYGLSKLAAESHVESLAAHGMAAISLRPPLIYGADAKGNWMLLQKIAALGVPLPLGSVTNRRSLIAVDNIVDAIMAVLATPRTRIVSGRFLVAEDPSVSVSNIVRLLRQGMGLPARLFPMPVPFLRLGLSALGRKAAAQSLLDNLEVDSRYFREQFGWKPGLATYEAIRESGRQFRGQRW